MCVGVGVAAPSSFPPTPQLLYGGVAPPRRVSCLAIISNFVSEPYSWPLSGPLRHLNCTKGPDTFKPKTKKWKKKTERRGCIMALNIELYDVHIEGHKNNRKFFEKQSKEMTRRGAAFGQQKKISQSPGKQLVILKNGDVANQALIKSQRTSFIFQLYTYY